MTLPRITPVILSGGSGTRLWPMSTPARPKQFLPLVADATMFAETLARTTDRNRFDAPIIVCGPGHVAHVEADLTAMGISDARIIVEPAARNTAPAIALAAIAAGADATPVLVMPSDHVMTNVAAFHAAIDAALPHVRGGALATFGIRPSGPETGYGYICTGETLGAGGITKVARFVEKPDRARAEAMLAGGDHLWNAGIFLMRADAYLAELTAQAPAMASACATAMADATIDGIAHHPQAEAFLASPSDSIDYAVMERAANVITAPVDPGWSDVGSWPALHDLAAKDEHGNSLGGDTLTIDTTNSLLKAAPGIRIATLGIDNLIVIATGTDVLVIPKDRAQDIKAIVEALKAS